MEPQEYIEGFFAGIHAQLDEAVIHIDSKTAMYRNLIVAASWTNQLWKIELQDGISSSTQQL